MPGRRGCPAYRPAPVAPKERHTGHLPTSYEGGVTDSRSVEPVVVVAVVEVVALGGGHGGDLGGEPLEIRLAWGAGGEVDQHLCGRAGLVAEPVDAPERDVDEVTWDAVDPPAAVVDPHDPG